MTTLPHQLAPDVFWCVSDGRIVFLDLRSNRYRFLGQENTRLAIPLLNSSSAIPSTPKDVDSNVDHQDTQRVVQALTEGGILVPAGGIKKEISPVCIKRPDRSLLSVEQETTPAIRSSHWAAFLHATLTASWKLRWYSMQRTVRSVENRKRRYIQSVPIEHNSLPELVSIFHQLRPYYGRKYLCLYDSLALVEFLAHFDVYPQWVFGVSAAPFSAHCWVQHDNCVMNDSLERVFRYTPIMII